MSFKKRFIALAVFFAVMIIGTVIYCLTTGGDCTVTMIHTGFPEGLHHRRSVSGGGEGFSHRAQ